MTNQLIHRRNDKLNNENSNIDQIHSQSINNHDIKVSSQIFGLNGESPLTLQKLNSEALIHFEKLGKKTCNFVKQGRLLVDAIVKRPEFMNYISGECAHFRQINASKDAIQIRKYWQELVDQYPFFTAKFVEDLFERFEAQKIVPIAV
jgi:hypothetical protein